MVGRLSRVSLNGDLRVSVHGFDFGIHALRATADLAAAVSSFIAFPVSPVIRPTLLHRFLGGTRTISPIARHVLVTELPYHPAEVTRRFGQSASCHTAFIGGQAIWQAAT